MPGEIQGVRGAPSLVVYHSKLRLLPGSGCNGADEIPPVAAEGPGGSQDKMFRTEPPDHLFAAQLRLAVNAQRVRRVRLSVGRQIGSFEDIVGAVMNEQ